MAKEQIFPTVTIGEAKKIISAMAHKQSILLLSAPGVGKSDAVRQAAQAAGLECKSLLGTQIAPEDVSGIPRIVGERSVFCPPRILLPEKPEKFCLFLDELPACSPDIQKAFYSLLLERRLGEHKLPEGTWVVAAGNRAEDRSLVRSLSAALVNRTIILQVRVDTSEWVQWALANKVRQDIIDFILLMPASLQRPVPNLPVPFSTPRAWASLSQALDLLEASGGLNEKTLEAVAFGSISAEDAALFTYIHKIDLSLFRDTPLQEYILHPENLPPGNDGDKDNFTMRWLLLKQINQTMCSAIIQRDGGNEIALNQLPFRNELTPEICNQFLQALPMEERVVVLLNCVRVWGELGADMALLNIFYQMTGVMP